MTRGLDGGGLRKKVSATLDGLSGQPYDEGMKTTTQLAIETPAIARAAKLCDAALATLAAGRKTFVKGKPVMVAWSPEKRAELKRLQLSAFDGLPLDADLSKHYADESVTDLASEERFLAEATEAYRTAGRTEVERRFA